MSVFEETQRFRHPLILMALGVPLLFSLWAVIRQVLLGKPVGSHPASDLMLVGTFLLLLAIGWLFWVMRLDTRVDESGIHYRFYPFHRQWWHLSWSACRWCWVRTYRPIGEYGGWGLRLAGRWGRAYNVSGSWGLQVVTEDDRRILWGTQRPDALRQVLKDLGRENPPPEDGD